MIATLSIPPRLERRAGYLHERLMATSRGLPNDELLAQMIRSHLDGEGALPSRLGLGDIEFTRLCARHFPGVVFTMPAAPPISIPRACPSAKTS